MKNIGLKCIAVIMAVLMLTGFVLPAAAEAEVSDSAAAGVTYDYLCDETEADPPAKGTPNDGNETGYEHKVVHKVPVQEELPDTFIERLFFYIIHGAPKTYYYCYDENGEFLRIEEAPPSASLFSVSKIINIVYRIIFG